MHRIRFILYQSMKLLAFEPFRQYILQMVTFCLLPQSNDKQQHNTSTRRNKPRMAVAYWYNGHKLLDLQLLKRDWTKINISHHLISAHCHWSRWGLQSWHLVWMMFHRHKSQFSTHCRYGGMLTTTERKETHGNKLFSNCLLELCSTGKP